MNSCWTIRNTTGALSFINRQHIKLDYCSCIILTYHAVFVRGQIHSLLAQEVAQKAVRNWGFWWLSTHPPSLTCAPSQTSILLSFPAVPRKLLPCNGEGAQKKSEGEICSLVGFVEASLTRHHSLKPAFVLQTNLLSLCGFFVSPRAGTATLQSCSQELEGVSNFPMPL